MSEEFFCHGCGDFFGAPVWECPKCGHHEHAGDPDRLCGNCHEASRIGRTSKVAQAHWDQEIMPAWIAANQKEAS